MGADKPQPPSEPLASERLDSWKEIAAYLKRDERTVRRWEKEGLPIHRHQHKQRAAVYAYKQELEAWWERDRLRLERPERTDSVARRQAIWLLALAGLFLAVLAATYGVRHLAPTTHIRSLAVLPLENLSGVPAQDYLADGMTDELTTDLAQIHALRVISRTSVLRYKGAKKALPEIANELNVDAVVEGTVLRFGDRLRVSAQLVLARADRHLWAQSYERNAADFLATEREVARAIANQIQVELTPTEQARMRAPRKVNPEAQEAYLEGRYFRNQPSEKGLRKAIASFQDALAKDPQYAPAEAALAEAYSILPFYSSRPPSDVYAEAKSAAAQAVALDNRLAEAHAVLGYLRAYYEWDWPAAEAEFHRALELNPNDAEVYHSYSRYLSAMGRTDEALVAIRRGEELDPLSLLVKANVGVIRYFARDYDRAVNELHKVAELDPSFSVAYWGMGLAHEQQGKSDTALLELEKSVELSHRSTNMLASLGHAYGLAGKRQDAQKTLRELEERAKHTYVSSYQLAVVYLGVGEKEHALAALDEAYKERSTLMTYLKMDPRLDPLRRDPRFVALLSRVGLPP